MPSLLDHLAASWPPENWREVGVIVGVSGGADSVALVTALAALRPEGFKNLSVAHFNHQTRGQESDEDEDFVRRLAQRLDLPFHAGRPAAAPAEWDTRDGFEAAAREARYNFLVDTARKTGARYVAVAHTADDQAETVQHRIVRGTGIAGLAGMPRARTLAPGVTLIRPLLAFRREEVRSYLREAGHEWREDASNANLDWTRNRIRGELLPSLARDYNPAVLEALLRLGELARQAQQAIDRQAETLLDAAVQDAAPEEVTISLAALRGQPEYLLCEFFIALWRRQGWPRQAYGRDAWRRLAQMIVSAVSGETTIKLPGAITVRRSGDVLSLARSGANQA